MILEMHQLLQHFAASEQIMKVLLGILIETFVAPNACVGGAKCDHYPTESAHSRRLDCRREGAKCETRESRRRRYFAILPGQQMVVCMQPEARS